MKSTSKLALLACLLLASASAFAAKGVVVLYKSGCNYYIVETNMGYTILEWYGGNNPSRGDVLTGDFETYGMKDVYNLSANAETKVWVEDFWLSQTKVIEKYNDKCN
jgi:hypothetical protein